MDHGKGLAFTEGQSDDLGLYNYTNVKKGREISKSIQTQKGKTSNESK